MPADGDPRSQRPARAGRRGRAGGRGAAQPRCAGRVSALRGRRPRHHAPPQPPRLLPARCSLLAAAPPGACLMPFEADLEAAQARIAGAVLRTPVWHSEELDEALGCSVWLKCEPLQRTGSFKLRGATNAIRALPAGTRGVVAVSSGNHAQAVACAGRSAGLPVTVVMNADANPAKRAATLGYGAAIVSDGVDPTNREEIARDLAHGEGFALVH